MLKYIESTIRGKSKEMDIRLNGKNIELPPERAISPVNISQVKAWGEI